MLEFNQEQQDAIFALRDQFNARQTALAANSAALAFEGNALSIPVDAWRRIDQRAQTLGRGILNVFGRLAQASTIPVSIADLVNYYPQIGDSGEVLVSMDGRAQAKADAPNVKYVGTPVPVLTSTARMGWRQMEVLRKGGSMMDVTAIANKQRKMAEKLEDMAINGLPSVNVGSDTIYGLRTLPQRNTFSHGFTLATATGAQVLAAFKAAIAAVLADNQFARITLFINQGDYTAFDTTDYAANYSGTILQRLKAVSQIADIVPASSVPVNEILGVAGLETGEWGGILSAMPMTTRPKNRSEPEDDYVFGVIAAAAPQFRADYNGQSPFLHGSL